MAEDVVGLRYVSEGLPEVLRGIQQYTSALNKIGQAEQKAAQGTTQRATATKSTTQADQQATQQQRAHETALKSKTAAEARATRETEKARQALQQIQAAIDPAVAAQQRMADAQRRVDDAVRRGIITQEQGRQTMARFQATMQQSTTAASALRSQMLATANSIAILDGPLGGVASRFSAFGVLIGRTGLLVGGLLVGLTGLSAVLVNSTRAFAEAERSMLRLQGVLEATGGAAGLTADEIEGMAQRVASSTLASVEGARAAAAALLTFRSVTGDVFGEVLMLAQDMAELGFGTMQSEAIKLAKAIEDPRQSLTSLSRSGVTFTLQQRKVIQSLVETGREAEATARILGIVSSQVGGAGTRSAQGFAGALDSIAQAIGNIAEQVGRGFLDINLTPLLPLIDEKYIFTVGDFIAQLGQQAADFNKQFEVASPAERLRELREERERLLSLPDPSSSISGRILNVFGAIDAGRAELIRENAVAIAEAEERVIELREKAERARLDKKTDEVADLKIELEQRRELIGLTEREIAVREALGKIGLRGNFPEGSEMAALQAQAADIAGTLYDTKKQQEFLRGSEAALESLRQQNAEAAVQNRYMHDSSNEARARAQQEILLNRLLESGVDASSRLFQEYEAATEESVRIAREADGIQRALDSAAEAAKRMEKNLAAAQRALGSLSAFGDSLGRQIAQATARVEALRTGGDAAAASRVAGLRADLDRRIREAADALSLPANVIPGLSRAGVIDPSITENEAKLRELEDALTEGNRLQRESSGSRSGGRGGGRETETLQSIIRDLDEQIDRERQIIGLTREEAAALDVKFEIIDKLRAAEKPFNEDQIAGIAEVIAARREENEILREQQETADKLRGMFEDTFADAISGAESFKDALGGLVQELNKMLLNKAFQTIVGSLGNGGGGGFFGRLGALLTPNANGNAFSNGRVMPFASGGVVSQPTVFPMVNGAGLMGEAGPEAIMPLARVNGKLGVQAGGGGTVVNNITVNAPPGSDVQEQRRQNSTGGEDLTIIIDRAVSNLARDPGSALSRTLGQNFGLRPATRGR